MTDIATATTPADRAAAVLTAPATFDFALPAAAVTLDQAGAALDELSVRAGTLALVQLVRAVRAAVPDATTVQLEDEAQPGLPRLAFAGIDGRDLDRDDDLLRVVLADFTWNWGHDLIAALGDLADVTIDVTSGAVTYTGTDTPVPGSGAQLDLSPAA